MHTEAPPPEIVDRLREHRTVGGAPRAELEWLAAHGLIRRADPGEYIARKGQTLGEFIFGLEIVLSGRYAIHVDRGAGSRKVMEWQSGDVTGLLPFSRMTTMVGDSVVEAPLETLSIAGHLLPELIRDCPQLTGILVHVMLDRARIFNTSAWQDEKMVSLGRLSAGLAHELNNPASAVVRCAATLPQVMAESERATRALAKAGLNDEELEAIEAIRQACMDREAPVSLSPMQRADREDRIASWLQDHGADLSALDDLEDTAVTLEALDELAHHLAGDRLDAALDWVAAGCAVRTLASTSEQAARRISELVSAMKRLTHMDQAPVREPVDLEQGIRDTLIVLGNKARSKSASVTVDVASDLPTVTAIGGELNQVWLSLIDNALDAVATAGSISVTVKPEGIYMVVRVVDDGPGIAQELQHRVFDPFFTTKPPGEGTGLGLEIARARVRGHGGEIEFDSRPGRTEFRVRLPLEDGGEGEGGG
jgi:signal transduction histidine kinase